MEGIVELVESGKTELSTCVYPRQPADTIIILHDGPGVPYQYAEIISELSHQYQVITFDQRGTGASRRGDVSYAVEDYIQDINAIAEHFGLMQFHLFGHGWGGLYAQLYIKAHPERVMSLCLSGTVPGTGSVWKRAYGEFRGFHQASAGLLTLPSLFLRSFAAAFGIESAFKSLVKQQVRHYQKLALQRGKPANIAYNSINVTACNKTVKKIVQHPAMPTRLKYQKPVLIIYASRDLYRRSRRTMKARFGNAIWVEEIADAGHFPWLDNPDAYFELLDEFYQLTPVARTGTMG